MHKNFIQAKTKFFDELFPPNINSIIKGYHSPNKPKNKKITKKTIGELILRDYKDISWKRDSDSSNNNNNINNNNIFPPDNIFINRIIYNKLRIYFTL